MKPEFEIKKFIEELFMEDRIDELIQEAIRMEYAYWGFRQMFGDVY